MTDFEIGIMLINKGIITDGVRAYEQGRADREKELSELLNEYSEKLWKLAYSRGKTDAIKVLKDKMDNLKEHYTDACSMCTKINCEVCHINEFIDDLEQLKEM